MIKDEIFVVIFSREGGYVDYFDDRGGLMYWGIILMMVWVNGYMGDMWNFICN